MNKRSDTPNLRYYKVFLSCPGDVREKRRIHRLVQKLNDSVWLPRNIFVKVLDWEEDVVPLLDARTDPQQVVNQQLNDYDVYLGLMWQRFGSPTGRFASGTQEELMEALKHLAAPEKGPRRVMFYFCEKPLTPVGEAALEQLRRVQEFRKALERLGIIGTWKTPAELEDRLGTHLIRVIDTLEASHMPSPLPTGTAPLTAEAPEQLTPGDNVLVLNFQADAEDMRLPRWVGELRAAGKIRVISGPAPRNNSLLQLLRKPTTTEEVQAAWTATVGELRRLVREAVRGSGQLFIFCQGPHGVGAALGRLIADASQQLRTYYFTFVRQQGGWSLQVLPEDLHPATGEFFRHFEVVASDPNAQNGVIAQLALFRHDAAQSREACAARVSTRYGIREVHGTRVIGTGWLSSPGEARAAIEALVAASEQERHSMALSTLHLMTDAPLAVLAEWVRSLKPSVYPRVIVHQYDPEGDSYYPTLDVGGAQIEVVTGGPQRARLEIFLAEDALLYRFNGEILPVARALPTGGTLPSAELVRTLQQQAADPRSEVHPEKELLRRIDGLSNQLLPAQVNGLLQANREVDIELRLEGPAAALPWEFLRPLEHSGNQVPLAANPQKTLVRRVEVLNHQPLTCPIPTPGEPLRVLIAPMLAPKEAQVYECVLELSNMAKWLEDEGVEMRRMEYGIELPAFQRELARFRPHVLYWIGHGATERVNATTPVAEVQYGGGSCRLDSIELALSVRGWLPRVVIFGSCEQAREGAFVAARNLLNFGVGAVIQFRERVDPATLRMCIGTFFRSILEGNRIDTALQAGRSALREAESHLKNFGAYANPTLVFTRDDALRPLVAKSSASTAE